MERKTEDVLRENAIAAAESVKRKKKKKAQNVAYGENGKRIKGKMKGWKKGGLGFLVFCLVLAAIIYLPPFFYTERTDNSYRQLIPDESALKTYQQYIKDNPDADFDGDGLLNSEEQEHGTDIWNVDTDNDGVFDSAELAITNTSPTSASSVQIDMVKADDQSTGGSLSTPYKIDDIIFWPDDYTSKAYGAVVRTMHGYRFWNYSGYVKFPEKVYAYEYMDGIHKPLPYREAEDAYRIDTNNEIRVYSEPLAFTNELSLPLIGKIYLDDGGFGDFLSDILPGVGGPVTCRHMAVIDTEPDTADEVTAPISLPYMDFSDLNRFGENQNTLQDLSGVRKQIEAGYCVAASIYSENTGETIAIIYGYDADGNLLVADTNLQPAGKLIITECAKKVINEEGVLGQMSWFEFSGFGFNSYTYGDRINFFASTITAVNQQEEPTKETEDPSEPAEEPVTENTTETETEPATESPATEIDQQETPPADTAETNGQPVTETDWQQTTETEPAAQGQEETGSATQTDGEIPQETESQESEAQSETDGGSLMTFTLN